MPTLELTLEELVWLYNETYGSKNDLDGSTAYTKICDEMSRLIKKGSIHENPELLGERQ